MNPTRRTWLPALLLPAIPLLLAPDAGAAVRQAFVTSVTGTGDLSSWDDAGGESGLAAGDAICRARAGAANLDNANSYRAWLSTSTVDAYCHVLGLTGTRADDCDGSAVGEPPAGPWARRDGQPFAAALGAATDPVDPRVYQPLLFDELGVEVPFVGALAWTGTGPDGTLYATSCLDWDSASNGQFGDTGSAGSVGRNWTYHVTLNCDQTARLLCLEPGAGDTLRVPTSGGALAFLSSTTGHGKLEDWSGGTAGLAGADEICQTLAASAALPYADSFVAWLSDSTTHATARLTFLGPFVRTDGFPLAATRAEMLGGAGKLLTGLNVTETVHYVAGAVTEHLAWTGTNSIGSVTAQHCTDWSSSTSGSLGTIGDSSTARATTWTNGGASDCSQPRRLYCLSNQPVLFWDGFERGDALKWSVQTP